jgi:ATP-dependent DNA ligase
VSLPIEPPVEPMLAVAATEVPTEPAGSWLYEPKWDGFRCIVFRDGDSIELGSRNGRPLTRYFPEVLEALREAVPARCVLDGEIVVVGDHGLDFDALGQRIHPAESRVNRLAVETPAAFVAFDVLAVGDEDLTARPFAERRIRLGELLDVADGKVHLTPATTDPAVAEDWFERFEGAGFDGVVAKPIDGVYEFGKRALVKVKHQRDADCVVAGFRVHTDGKGVGSLLLGLFDDAGRFQFVGVASGFRAAQRRELLDELAPLRDGAAADHPWLATAGSATATGAGTGSGAQAAAGTGEDPAAEDDGIRRPGGPSRWNAKKDLAWEPLRPERVCEVRYNQIQGDPQGRWGPPARFRHSTSFQRWRPDRDPASCTFDQLRVTAPPELAEIFAS